MIRKFSVLYVGQIDLDNVGRDGTPADQRRYPNERVVEAYRSMVDVARVMDDAGYYCLWTAEHHFQREGYEVLPNLILVGTYLARGDAPAQVRLRVQHPARCGTRSAWPRTTRSPTSSPAGGSSWGSAAATTRARSSPSARPLLDAAANIELFEEQLELMSEGASTRSSSLTAASTTRSRRRVQYRGYELSEVTLVPRPVHRPVEIWQPIASGKTIDFLAKHDLKGMVTLNGERITDQVFHAYRDACARHGREKRLGEDLCLGLGFHMAESKEEAIRRVEPAHDERYKWFAPFGFVRYADDAGPALGHARGAGAGADSCARAWSRRPGWSARRPTASR